MPTLTKPAIQIATKEQDDFVTELQARLKGCQFASLQYRTKQYFNAAGQLIDGGELARYVIILGFNYVTLLEKSLLELEIQKNEGLFKIELKVFAAQEVKDSLEKSLAAHRIGQQSEDYTKKGLYKNVVQGLNLNPNDNSFQLFGKLRTKVIIEPGKHKKVQSAAITIAKREIRKTLPISLFREFAVDNDTMEKAKIAGDTIVLV